MAKRLTEDQEQTIAEMLFAEWSRCKSDYDPEEISDIFTVLGFHNYAFEVLKWAEPEDSTFEFLPSKD